MGFAEEVAELTARRGGSSTVGHVVRVLNELPAKERSQIVAFLDNLPAGTVKADVATKLTERAKKVGLPIKINSGAVTSFITGNRNGLKP